MVAIAVVGIVAVVDDVVHEDVAVAVALLITVKAKQFFVGGLLFAEK